MNSGVQTSARDSANIDPNPAETKSTKPFTRVPQPETTPIILTREDLRLIVFDRPAEPPREETEQRVVPIWKSKVRTVPVCEYHWLWARKKHCPSLTPGPAPILFADGYKGKSVENWKLTTAESLTRKEIPFQYLGLSEFE